MIDKYKKGRRVYTHWDKKTEQVTVLPEVKKDEQPSVQAPNIAVEVPQEHVPGKRANVFVVHNSGDDFVLDCALRQPGSEKVRVVSRVVMSPKTAKRLMKTLEKNIEGD